MIRLNKVAPWNKKLRHAYRTWFAEVSGRHFRITAQGRDGWWNVEEITTEGDYVRWVAVCVRNLPAARRVIEDDIAGVSPEEIQLRAMSAPPVGTGRNHPKNVDRRRSWKF